jgi:hypothetical protein
VHAPARRAHARTIRSGNKGESMINEYRIDQLTNDQLRRYYDRRPNLTLQELSKATGKTIAQLKQILLEKTV